MAVVAAAGLGFGGAAAIDSALAEPPIEVADGYGPAGDGRTRLVVTAEGGIDTAALAALEAAGAVDSAQLLFDGSALVAGFGITPRTVRAVLPDAEATVSVPGEVASGQPITDPYWALYGYNLSNTGSNAYNQAAVAGADVAAPVGWQAGTGRGLTVAVIDTGVMTSHPDLAGALWTNPGQPCGAGDTDGNGYAGDCHGWNFYANNADVTNGGDSGHGTGVAGVVGARAGNGHGSAGVAPDVTIMPLVIGGGSSVDLRLGAQAIRYAADNGADVVNASWGGNNSAQILTDAIAYANSKGVVVVAAAGNDALDRDTSLFYPASLIAENLVTVGNSTASDTVSASSAYGATSVDLFAPGTHVVTTHNDGGYRAVSGTSIAAPHVAAAFALYRAHDEAATAAELVGALLADVQPVAAFAGKSVTGGRLSLSALGGTPAPVTYTFSGMVAEAGTVVPQVVVSGSGGGATYSVRLGLGMEHEGSVYALTDHPVTVNGTTVRTDDSGEADFNLGYLAGLGSLVVSPSTDLAEGRYVLTAHLVQGGTPVGLAHAAPLLVGEAGAPVPADGGPAPGTPVPGASTPAPGGSAPGGSAPAPGGSTPVPGGSTPAPGSSTPTPGSSTPAPGGSTPAPGGAAPAPGSAPAPGGATPTPGGSSPAPGGSAPAPGSSTPTPGSSTPTPGGATPTPGGRTPAPDGSTPAPGGSIPAPSGGTAPDLGGVKTYPQVGPFRLTSISPTRVSTAGGTRVVVTGEAIPAGARVRVGSTAQATVLSASTTSLSFTTPARVAGGYDVFVFAPDGTSTVLTAGLTYLDVTGGPDAPAPAPGGAAPAPGTPGDGQEPAAGTGGSAVTGPNGERLLPSARFAALGTAIWRVDCSSTCGGLPV
ncbi:S8 family serine peptidase [Geodermatophilus sp. SYSU D00758]